MTRIYKLAPREEWDAAQGGGAWPGSDDDRRDGFIHFSAEDQVQSTAEVHFPGRDDLLLIEVDADRLGGALKWEPSRNGGRFPHLYGELPLAAVVDVRPFVPDPVSCGQSPEAGPGVLT